MDVRPHEYFVKSLRFRIALTWFGFAIIGSLLLFGFAQPLLIAICCLAISTARRFVKPSFPRSPRWFERLVYMLLLPAIFFFGLGLWFGFSEPWAQVAHIGLWICLPLLLAFAAYQDAKVWKGERVANVA